MMPLFSNCCVSLGTEYTSGETSSRLPILEVEAKSVNLGINNLKSYFLARSVPESQGLLSWSDFVDDC